MKRLGVFGSTGSIGCNTVDLIARAPGDFDVVALTGGRNVARLAEQARMLGARVAVTAHDECYADLKEALAGSGIAAAAGQGAIVEAAARQFGLTFIEPAFLGRDLTFGIRSFYTTSESENADYSIRTIGFEPFMEFQTGELSRLRLSYNLAEEEIYDVEVMSVNVMTMPAKINKMRGRRKVARRAVWKKAIVTLPKGERIDIFEGV